jgi:SNF2 family DNA or RNA helicase
MSNEVRLVKIGTTPVFLIPGNKMDSWGHVFGAQYVEKLRSWVCPAYRPFLDNVIRDIDTLNENVLSAETKNEAYAQALTKEDWLAHNAQNPPPGSIISYEHQKEGTAELLANYRWYLRWEMGTGKTKVAVDALTYLKTKTIVICPVIAINTWHREIALHSAGTLTSIAIIGTPKQKMNKLVEAKDFDVVIMSYDTARMYSIPVLCAEAQGLRKKSQVGTTKNHTRVLDAVALIHSIKDQIALLTSYYAGKATADEIVKLVDQLNGGTVPFLSGLTFDTIILDEAHRVKNIRSQRTKAINALATRASRRYLLSGTPTVGDPRDFYTQLRILSPFLMPEEWHNFVPKFCDISPHNKHIVRGYKNMNIINERVNSVSSERKLTNCVSLPPRKDIDIRYSLTGNQLMDYNVAVRDCQIHIGLGKNLDFKHGAIRLTKLMQMCSGFYYMPKAATGNYCDTCEHLFECVSKNIEPGTNRCSNAEAKIIEIIKYKENPKLEALKDLLEDLLEDPEHKVIIWGNYTEELDDVEKLIKKMKFEYVRVDGTNTQHIKKYEERFQTDKECRVYLGQIHTGIAVTLTAAKYSVYYSRAWSLDAWDQSRGRNFRIGQTQKTVVYRLVGSYSVERQQLIALDNRHDIATVLTKRVECVVCDEYEACLKKEIAPWCEGCVLDARMAKYMTKPEVIQPGIGETPLVDYIENLNKEEYASIKEQNEDADYFQ